MTTEMTKQYNDLKAKHPDVLLLFRCGDFYETYEDDAETASKVLGITLTKSSKDGSRLAGFPYHALDSYLPRLIRAGQRVAICDQLETPRKPLAKRSISEMVKPAPTTAPKAESTSSSTRLGFKVNDGGRSSYFKANGVGDCVVRAAAIASGKDYMEVYELARTICKGSPRDGVSHTYTKRIMARLGGEWHPTMSIGSGCTTHLRAGEIPMNKRLVCNVSKHVTAVIDGVINDTYDCSREGGRCVYGYWIFPNIKQ